MSLFKKTGSVKKLSFSLLTIFSFTSIPVIAGDKNDLVDVIAPPPKTIPTREQCWQLQSNYSYCMRDAGANGTPYCQNIISQWPIEGEVMCGAIFQTLDWGPFAVPVK